MPNHSEQIVVTVDDSHVSNIESVAVALGTVGMQVANILATSGIITGAVDQEKLVSLRSVAGVANVESDGEMRAI